MIPGERHIEWSDVREVALRRGRNSRCPDLWRGLAALWLPGWDGLNSHDILGRDHMTAVNSPTRAVGPLGPCILFDDAQTQYLFTPSTFGASFPITVAVWALADSAAVGAPVAFGDADGTGRLLLYRSGTTLYCYTGTTQGSVSGFVQGAWNHCVGVWGGTSYRRASCNGVHGTPSTGWSGVGPTLDVMALGALRNDDTVAYPWSGQLAYPGAWRRHLSDDMIEEHADGGWWRMLTPRPEMESMYVPSGEEPAGTPWLYAHRRSARIEA